MNNNKIKLLVLILLFTFLINVCFAEQIVTERQLKQMPPSAVVVQEEKTKEKFFAYAFYEPSDVVIGSNNGTWNEITEAFGYMHKNFSLYLATSQLERLHEWDYTINAGTYFNFKDYYFHEEIGFGEDVTYIYKFQNVFELSHRLYKSLYWQIGYTYRHYLGDDSHLISPGLTYYFGNNYISAYYGMPIIETRGNGNLGTIKGDFEIMEPLHLQGGVTVGQWLYDIYGYDASDEGGYILYAGLNWRIYKEVHVMAGYSYGTEDPRFIKRSFDFSVSAKF
jgi:YaiO family outer membrane protein